MKKKGISFSLLFLLFLSLDSRLKTNEGKKGKGRKEGRYKMKRTTANNGGERRRRREKMRDETEWRKEERERERSARVRVIRVHPVC